MSDLSAFGLSSPPTWSLTVGSIGRFLVIAAIVLFTISVGSWLFDPKNKKLRFVGAWSFTLGCLSLLGTFTALASLFIGNRFEFNYVWAHADTKNAIPYRIAGIWSGQEGSFLLWACCAAMFGLLTMRLTAGYRRWYTIAYSLFLGSLAAILAYESPFNLNTTEGMPGLPQELVGLPFTPVEGLGLAPSLQNYWVTIHPPTIFLGFGSLTVLFALAFAALMKRDYESWIPIVRPWSIVAVTLVGVGLCMGGFWAYETLGWGGFWMWDPVENVSFVPWCFAVAFTHGVIVQATRNKWKVSNLILGGLPFLAFVYGTFLTRSGFLADTSVHSFAEMDRSALWLLVGLMFSALVGFGGLWLLRAFQANKAAREEPLPGDTGLRRELFYRLGIIFLLVMGVATMIGMSVPLIMALGGKEPKVVQEGLYHQVMPWVFVPIMLLMAIAPFVSWRSMKPADFLSRLFTVACIAIGLTGFSVFLAAVTPYGRQINLAPEVSILGMEKNGLILLLLLVGVCYFAIVGNVWRMMELGKRSKLGLSPFLAHAGVAILMTGLIVSRGFERSERTVVMEDHPGKALGYFVQYKGMTSVDSDRDNKVLFDIISPTGKQETLFTAQPGYYKMAMADGQENVMVWPYIFRSPWKDVYLSLSPPQEQSSEEFSLGNGKTVTFAGLRFENLGLTREGEVAQAGTKFGAKIKVTAGDTTKVVEPKLGIAPGGGTTPEPASLDDGMELVMLGMNATDKSVMLQVRLSSLAYPIEIFHKPMTILVWFGTGLMTIAGFLSAVYRRPRKSTENSLEEELELVVPQRELVPLR